MYASFTAILLFPLSKKRLSDQEISPICPVCVSAFLSVSATVVESECVVPKKVRVPTVRFLEMNDLSGGFVLTLFRLIQEFLCHP
jgi:hypothetical protein